MTSRIASLSSKAALFVAAGIVALACAFGAAALQPAQAFADNPTYTMTVSSDSGSIAPGDTFTVNVDLSRDGADTYPMYALSATIRYDSSMLELTDSTKFTRVDMYSSDQGDGNVDLVLNFLSSKLSGTTWNSPTTVVSLTFTAKEQGSSMISIRRVNVSNTTGMGSYACACTDGVVSVSESGGEAVVTPSSDTSEGTTEGVAAEEADLSNISEDTFDWANLTDDEKAELEALGYDVDALVAQYADESAEEGVATGTIDSSAATTSAENAGTNLTDSTGTSASGSGIPLAIPIAIAVVVLIAIIVAIVMVKRKKKAEQETAIPRRDMAGAAQVAQGAAVPRQQAQPTQRMQSQPVQRQQVQRTQPAQAAETQRVRASHAQTAQQQAARTQVINPAQSVQNPSAPTQAINPAQSASSTADAPLGKHAR